MTVLSNEKLKELLLRTLDTIDQQSAVIAQQNNIIRAMLTDTCEVPEPVQTTPTVQITFNDVKTDVKETITENTTVTQPVVRESHIAKRLAEKAAREKELNGPIPTDYGKKILSPEDLEGIKPFLTEGDVVWLNHAKYGLIPFDVVGKNIDGAGLVTLISKNIVFKRYFDINSIVYKESSLREELNGRFLEELEIRDYVQPVVKKTLSDTDHQRLVKSDEYVWIPSKDELGIYEMSANDLSESNRYPVIKNMSERAKTYMGEPAGYFLRTCLKDNGSDMLLRFCK